MKLLMVNIVIVMLFGHFVTGAPAPYDLSLGPIVLMESIYSALFDSDILTTHPGTIIPYSAY